MNVDVPLHLYQIVLPHHANITSNVFIAYMNVEDFIKVAAPGAFRGFVASSGLVCDC